MGSDRSMSREYFSKSSTWVMDNGRLFSLTLILIMSPEIKKLLILPRLCSFLLLDHCALKYEHKLWFIKSLFWPVRSTSSIFILRRYFFTAKLADNPSCVRTWRWLSHSFYLLCGKLPCSWEEYCNLASQICSQTFPQEHLLRLHWVCLLCLDILILNTER